MPEDNHLTREQHQARAMLLGYNTYDQRGGTYCKVSNGELEMLCCLELCSVSVDDLHRRAKLPLDTWEIKE